MKKKTNLKILLMFGLILFAIILLLSNKSYASTTVINSDFSGKVNLGVITEGTINEETLNSIPNTMTFNMQTTKLENLEELIMTEIGKELKTQGITLKYVQTSWGAAQNYLYMNLERQDLYINKATIELYYEGGTTTKDISIQWTNKNTPNANDKTYIDNLLKNMGFSKDETGNYNGKFEKNLEIGKDIWSLDKDIKENTIILKDMGGGAGWDDYFEGGYTMYYEIFKNGVYYTDCVVECNCKRQLFTIPNNIEDTDTAYINYALPKLNEILLTDGGRRKNN